jgi:hypothetical protein
MNDLTMKFAVAFCTFGVLLAVSLVLAYPYMIIWNNCLVPAIPALQKVEWLQMWGIAVLIQSLLRTGK